MSQYLTSEIIQGQHQRCGEPHTGYCSNADGAWDRDALACYAHTSSWERVAKELEHLYTDTMAERQRIKIP